MTRRTSQAASRVEPAGRARRPSLAAAVRFQCTCRCGLRQAAVSGARSFGGFGLRQEQALARTPKADVHP